MHGPAWLGLDSACMTCCEAPLDHLIAGWGEVGGGGGGVEGAWGQGLVQVCVKGKNS